MPDDDLGDLWDTAPTGPALPVHHRQGKIIAFNQVTGANTVLIGKTQVSNLPMYGVAEAATLTAGAKVGILSTGRQMYIAGRIVEPNSAGYTDAVNRLSSATLSQSVAAGESTTNTTYTDLATVGPVLQATVKSSGRLIVLISASILALADQTGVRGGSMGVEVRDSANNVLYLPASLPELTHSYSDNATHTLGDIVASTRVILLEGLTPDTYTLIAKYQAGASGNTAQFANRNLTTIAL